MSPLHAAARSLGASTLVLALAQAPAHGTVDPPYAPDYATYFGGSGWERAQSVYIDAQGALYVGGSTQSHDFPTTSGAFDRTSESGTANDGYVAKFAADGTLLWSTYLQGSARDDVYGVRADAQGNVIVTGSSFSTDFPTTPGAYDRTLAGNKDVFVAKLSADGSSLLWSTFVGGAGPDHSAFGAR